MDYNFLCSTVKRHIVNSNYYSQDHSTHPSRTLVNHDLFYIVEGSWSIAQDDKEYEISAGDVVFLQGGHHHYGPSPSRGLVKTIYVEFSKNSLDAIQENAAVADNAKETLYSFPVITHCQNNSNVRKLLEQIVSCYWADENYIHAKASAYLDLLLCELSGTWRKEDSIASEIKKIIRQNPGRFFSNQELAEIFNCSIRTLTKNFRESTGNTIHAWQLKLKCQMAEALIKQDPTITLREISSNYGFCDEYHFSKCFKKIMGYAPKSPKSTDI